MSSTECPVPRILVVRNRNSKSSNIESAVTKIGLRGGGGAANKDSGVLQIREEGERVYNTPFLASGNPNNKLLECLG